MAKRYFKVLFILMISILLISCGGEKVMKTAPSFEPYQFDANKYVPKVDNFVVILDTSSSMADKYGHKEKDNLAKELLTDKCQDIADPKVPGHR